MPFFEPRTTLTGLPVIHDVTSAAFPLVRACALPCGPEYDINCLANQIAERRCLPGLEFGAPFPLWVTRRPPSPVKVNDEPSLAISTSSSYPPEMTTLYAPTSGLPKMPATKPRWTPLSWRSFRSLKTVPTGTAVGCPKYFAAVRALFGVTFPDLTKFFLVWFWGKSAPPFLLLRRADFLVGVADAASRRRSLRFLAEQLGTTSVLAFSMPSPRRIASLASIFFLLF